MPSNSRFARQSTADRIISENNLREKQFREFYRDLLAAVANADYEAGVTRDDEVDNKTFLVENRLSRKFFG